MVTYIEPKGSCSLAIWGHILLPDSHKNHRRFLEPYDLLLVHALHSQTSLASIPWLELRISVIHCIGLAIIKRQKITSIAKGMKKTETLVYCWWKFKTVQLLWKTVWHFLLQLQVTIFSTAFSSLYMIIFKSQFSLKKSTSKQIMFVLDLNIAVQNNYHTTNLNCLKKTGGKLFYSIPSLKYSTIN